MKAAAVVLAGRGRRFGSETKQLALVDGRPLVCHAAQSGLDAGLDEVVVVVGHHADAVAATLPDDPRVRVVFNPRFEQGQSTSLREGLDALSTDVEVAIVLLEDVPDVASASVVAVRDAVAGGSTVARARYDDGASHPVAFARSMWGSLRRLTGDEGARHILSDFDVTAVNVRGPCPTDIDRPGDLW